MVLGGGGVFSAEVQEKKKPGGRKGLPVEGKNIKKKKEKAETVLS